MRPQRQIVVVMLALGGSLVSLLACEIRVRDSAFRTVRDVHRLCLIADSRDESAGEIEQELQTWIDQQSETLNLQFQRVDADDPETNWQSLGIPSAPPSLPVTVLVGRDNGIGQSFLVDHWEPVPNEAQLAELLDSPMRRELAGQLATNLAVLIYAPARPGNRAGEESVRSIVEAGIADERIGLSMMTLDRSDPAERLLCKFMGVVPESPDTLCVAFGRGKLMAPPLVGNEINADNVEKLISQIRQACSCSKPLPTMGVDLPMVWSDAVDSTVILMDAELDLDQLDSELQNVLADESTDDSGSPTLVAIPGEETQSTPPASPAAAINRQQLGVIVVAAVICLLLLVIGMQQKKNAISKLTCQLNP